FGQVLMLTDGGDQCLELRALKLLETSDLASPKRELTWIATGLAAVLDPHDVFTELVDEGEMLRKSRQSRIRSRMDLLGRCGAGCDQGRVDLVVLGSLPLKLGIGAHLRRLEYDHGHIMLAQRGHHLLLVAAARLDADALHPLFAQPLQQGEMA